MERQRIYSDCMRKSIYMEGLLFADVLQADLMESDGIAS